MYKWENTIDSQSRDKSVFEYETLVSQGKSAYEVHYKAILTKAIRTWKQEPFYSVVWNGLKNKETIKRVPGLSGFNITELEHDVNLEETEGGTIGRKVKTPHFNLKPILELFQCTAELYYKLARFPGISNATQSKVYTKTPNPERISEYALEACVNSGSKSEAFLPALKLLCEGETKTELETQYEVYGGSNFTTAMDGICKQEMTNGYPKKLKNPDSYLPSALVKANQTYCVQKPNVCCAKHVLTILNPNPAARVPMIKMAKDKCDENEGDPGAAAEKMKKPAVTSLNPPTPTTSVGGLPNLDGDQPVERPTTHNDDDEELIPGGDQGDERPAADIAPVSGGQLPALVPVPSENSDDSERSTSNIISGEDERSRQKECKVECQVKSNPTDCLTKCQGGGDPLSQADSGDARLHIHGGMIHTRAAKPLLEVPVDNPHTPFQSFPPLHYCFGGQSTVMKRVGWPGPRDGAMLVQMSSLKPGDIIRTAAGEEPVLGMIHASATKSDDFLDVSMNDGSSLVVSPNHILFTPRGEGVFASLLTTGMELATSKRISRSSRIRSIKNVAAQGFYAPLTASGTIVVGGTQASCYASTSHSLAHMGVAPFRLIVKSIALIVKKRFEFIYGGWSPSEAMGWKGVSK